MLYSFANIECECKSAFSRNYNVLRNFSFCFNILIFWYFRSNGFGTVNHLKLDHVSVLSATLVL